MQGDEVRIAVTIPKALDRAMEMECARRDIPKKQLIAEALDAFLNSGRPA